MEQTDHTHTETKNKGGWNLKPEMIIGFIGLIIFILFIGFVSAKASPTSTNNTASNNSAPSTEVQAANTSVPTEAPTTPKPTPTFTPTPTQIQYDTNGFPEDAVSITVADLAKIPSSYQDKKVTFTCDVVSFPKDDKGNAAGINCSDPNDSSSIVQVQMGAFDQTVKINTNDTVVVYGMGRGAAEGTNAFGGRVTEALVLELHSKDLTTGWSK